MKVSQPSENTGRKLPPPIPLEGPVVKELKKQEYLKMRQRSEQSNIWLNIRFFQNRKTWRMVTVPMWPSMCFNWSKHQCRSSDVCYDPPLAHWWHSGRLWGCCKTAGKWKNFKCLQNQSHLPQPSTLIPETVHVPLFAQTKGHDIVRIRCSHLWIESPQIDPSVWGQLRTWLRWYHWHSWFWNYTLLQN